jgi:hypothetical protein
MKEMLMRYCLNATALLAAALLAGCANVVYEGRLSWKEGWRKDGSPTLERGLQLRENLPKIASLYR